jgi:CheY-like chemotaxis protein
VKATIETPPPPQPAPRKIRILAVDDDLLHEDTLALYEESSALHNVTFVGEWDPFRALTELKTRNYQFFDAVLLDLSIPDFNGRRLTEEIREKESGYPREQPLELFWYTGLDIDLDDPQDPYSYGRTFRECRVRQLFTKGTDSLPDVTGEIKRIILKNREKDDAHHAAESKSHLDREKPGDPALPGLLAP